MALFTRLTLPPRLTLILKGSSKDKPALKTITKEEVGALEVQVITNSVKTKIISQEDGAEAEVNAGLSTVVHLDIMAVCSQVRALFAHSHLKTLKRVVRLSIRLIFQTKQQMSRVEPTFLDWLLHMVKERLGVLAQVIQPNFLQKSYLFQKVVSQTNLFLSQLRKQNKKQFGRSSRPKKQLVLSKSQF